MFKGNKQEVFSLRKYKNGRTDSKLIGATILALGVGLVTTTNSVSADVVNGAGGSEVALVDSVDKTTSVNTNTFTDNTDTTKTAKFDAVLNKGVAEPTKANENKGEADGTDTVTVTSETTVNYKLEEDKSLLKTETVATGQGTIKTPYDKKGIAADTDGKDYRESTADKSGITVSEETGKQDTLELNDKVYERTRSEVEGADKAKYSKTQFNDIEASVSPEGMHNKLGEIDYTKTTGKVYLVEETADGQYGKFVETTGVSSDEDAVSKWKAGLANAKDFTKANVTLQEGDSILVLDKDTYAVGNSKTIKNVKRYNGFTFGFAENSVDVDRNTSFDNPTYSLAQNGSGESANILEAGADGIFGTADDVRKTVDKNELFDFEDGGEWLSESIKEDLKPFFDYKDYVPLDPSTNPTLATAIKKQKMYNRIYQILDFAQNEATSPEDKAKVVETKAKLDSYLEGVAAKLSENGVKLAYLTENTASGSVKKGYYLTGGTGGFIVSDEARDLISPNGSGVSKILDGLTFSNLKETTFHSAASIVETTTSVRKDYTLNGSGSFNVVITTTKKSTYVINKGDILAENEGNSQQLSESEFSELVKSGNVKVNDDGSVTVTTVETLPTTKFYKVGSLDSPDVDDPSKEVQPNENGVFRITLEDKEREDLFSMRGVSESSHNETTYNKREIITPIRAYKVVADGISTVTHYYRVKKAPVVANYYLENTTTSLAPSETQADLPVKSDYTIQSKMIEPKTEVQDLPEKTVTTVTTYELVGTPDNATGKVVEGGTTVNYYYHAVVKTTEVAKQAPVVVNHYLENTEIKLADSVNQGQKDIGSNYVTESVSIPNKVEVQDLEDRVVTKTTTYALVSEPTDKNGQVPVGGKVVNYYYRAVVKEDVVMKQAPVVANYYLENTTDKLADSDEQGQKDIGSQYSTSAKEITPKVEVQDLEDRIVTKTTTYELVSEPTDKEGVVPVGGKVVNYFYRAVVKEDTIMKKAPVLVNYFEDGTETKLADSVNKGEQEIGSNYTSEAKEIAPIRDVQELPEKTVVTTTTYTLKEKPSDAEGIVPVGGKVINYYYVKTVTVDETPKTAPVVANYYLDGTKDKLADSVDYGLQNIGSKYSTDSKEIPSKTEVVETPEKTVTTTTTYTLKEVPSDKVGQVPVGGKVVNFYYVPNVTVNEVLKQAPVVANYYLEGTTDKLADSDNQGDRQIGSNYSTVSKEITSKTEVQDLVDRVITKVTTYELVATPTDAKGTVPSEGKVVNYYYHLVVNETVVMKKAPLTVNYLLEGTREALHPQSVQDQLVINSEYTTSAVEITPKVERRVERNKEVITTTRYELVATPNNAQGTISVGGTVVDYFYRAVITSEEYPTIPNEAPKTDLPEYTEPIGIVPNDAPIHELPEYKEPIGRVPNDAPRVELPEFKGGVIPNDAPKVEIPAYDGGVVPNDSPILEKPEYHEPIDSVPTVIPKVERPEFKGGIVPNDSPILEKLEYKIPTVSEEPKQPVTPIVETPKTPQPQSPQPKAPEKYVSKELPNTGTSESDKLVALSGLGLLGLLGVGLKKREEE